MRRLPLFILIDTSGSMRGEALAAAANGLHSLLVAIRALPHIADRATICFLTFDRDVNLLVPFTALTHYSPPSSLSAQSAPSHLGKALETVAEIMVKECNPATYEAPICLIFTDGSPTDLLVFREFCNNKSSLPEPRFVFLTPNPSCELTELKRLTSEFISLDTANQLIFTQLFGVHNNASAQLMDQDKPGTDHLPPPPPEFNLVI